jgi:hypothetical protein
LSAVQPGDVGLAACGNFDALRRLRDHWYGLATGETVNLLIPKEDALPQLELLAEMAANGTNEPEDCIVLLVAYQIRADKLQLDLQASEHFAKEAVDAGSMDPYLRETRSIVDAIKNRVPVLAEGLPVRRNIWGDPVKRGDAFGPDYISPVYASQEEGSPFLLEVARLRAPLSLPSRSLRIEGKTHTLTAEQYDAYVQLSGQPARLYLEQFTRTPEWRSMDDDTRRELLKETMTEFRASAREGLKERYPELQGGKLPPMPEGYVLPPLPPGFVLAK